MTIDTIDIEIELAEYLAEVWNREPEAIRIIEEVMGLYVDADAIEVYEEGMIDGALDKIAEREAAFRRPRSPLEMAIDRACGMVR